MICPFCGRESKSNDYCTACHSLFNKQVRQIAYTAENDPRSDRIGPFSTKTAKRLLILGIIALVSLFIIFTEMTGQGLSTMGK